MSRLKNRASNKGQSFIEVIVGSMLLVPIALFGLDVMVIVLASSANDTLAKNAARAAANQSVKVLAVAAAQKYVASVPKSAMVLDAKLDGSIDYQDKKQVEVKTAMKVKVPAAFAGMDVVELRAVAVEPIVAGPADI